MDWYAGECSARSCPQPNENSNHTFRLMESLNGGPWEPKGTPEHGMAHDQFTPYPETANQHWFVDGKQVQVVVGWDSNHNLIRSWEIRVVINQMGKRPEYSAVP